MRFDIITIFPKIFDSYFNESILTRAQENKLIEIKVHNLRDYTEDKHKTVDDSPYGGGPGMVMKADVIVKAIEKVASNKKQETSKTKVILFSPAGKKFDNKMAASWAKKYNHLILVPARYEGMDERVKKVFKAEEISIGPYVLTGGEVPAMVVVDAVSRQLKGVLGKEESLEEKRHGIGVPMYTRPEVLEYKGKKYKVPPVLLSGNHKKIAEWRNKNSASKG